MVDDMILVTKGDLAEAQAKIAEQVKLRDSYHGKFIREKTEKEELAKKVGTLTVQLAAAEAKIKTLGGNDGLSLIANLKAEVALVSSREQKVRDEIGADRDRVKELERTIVVRDQKIRALEITCEGIQKGRDKAQADQAKLLEDHAKTLGAHNQLLAKVKLLLGVYGNLKAAGEDLAKKCAVLIKTKDVDAKAKAERYGKETRAATEQFYEAIALAIEDLGK